jgi:GAG-pre-integrase domain
MRHVAIAVNVNQNWIIDSEASRHICRDRGSFTSLSPASEIILTASGAELKAHGEGKVILTISVAGTIKKIILDRILYVPECSFNLLFIYELAEAGITVQIEKKGLKLYRQKEVIAEAKSERGTYLIRKVTTQWALTVQEAATGQLWHRRLSHLSTAAGQQIHQLVDGLDGQKPFNGRCDACEEAKSTRQPSRIPMRPTQKKLTRIHVDI